MVRADLERKLALLSSSLAACQEESTGPEEPTYVIETERPKRLSIWDGASNRRLAKTKLIPESTQARATSKRVKALFSRLRTGPNRNAGIKVTQVYHVNTGQNRPIEAKAKALESSNSHASVSRLTESTAFSEWCFWTARSSEGSLG